PIVLASPLSDAATTEIYTLSLHDALPICRGRRWRCRLLPKRWGRSTWCCLSGWCLGVSRPRSDNTYITRIYLDVNTWLGEVNPPIPHPPEPLPRQMLPRQPRRLEKRPRVHLQRRPHRILPAPVETHQLRRRPHDH